MKRPIKIIRIAPLENWAHQKMTIQGVWGGRLDIDFAGGDVREPSNTIIENQPVLAYLPPFVKNLVLESTGFLFNSDSERTVQVYILNRNNTILDVVFPQKIGECNLWRCKVPINVFNKMRKLIISKGGKPL